MESERQTKVENNEVGESIWRVTKSLSMNVSFFQTKVCKSSVTCRVTDKKSLNTKQKKQKNYDVYRVA